MDLTHQSHTLDLALKASRARRFAPIRLLVNDALPVYVQTHSSETKVAHICWFSVFLEVHGPFISHHLVETRASVPKFGKDGRSP